MFKFLQKSVLLGILSAILVLSYCVVPAYAVVDVFSVIDAGAFYLRAGSEAYKSALLNFYNGTVGVG